MGLTTIYVVRHAVRVNWTVDPATGRYTHHGAAPTGISGDVPLAAHGVDQSRELAQALLLLSPPISRVYSSPFYRCLETLQPFISQSCLAVRANTGLGEFFGRAAWDHPRPATSERLHALLPCVDEHWSSATVPREKGETIKELHERIAHTMCELISLEDTEDVKNACPDERAILICTHAASLIAIGRTLTGQDPVDPATEDFETYTAGISKFVRRQLPSNGPQGHFIRDQPEGEGAPLISWRGGKGVAGGWDCAINSDCSHLSNGPERGWHFHGDEGHEEHLHRYKVGQRGVSTEDSRGSKL